MSLVAVSFLKYVPTKDETCTHRGGGMSAGSAVQVSSFEALDIIGHGPQVPRQNSYGACHHDATIYLNLPKDSLDIVLAATYNHSTERFADKEDLCLQPETIGCETWRRLRNTLDKYPPVPVPLGHPMKRGGITERNSPFSVKLMNSGVHSSQTNPGYSRQPAGGAIFFY